MMLVLMIVFSLLSAGLTVLVTSLFMLIPQFSFESYRAAFTASLTTSMSTVGS
jgi:hypothetical protein